MPVLAHRAGVRTVSGEDLRTTFFGVRATVPVLAQSLCVSLPCIVNLLPRRLVLLGHRTLTIDSIVYGTVELMHGLPLHRDYDEAVNAWPVLRPSIMLQARVSSRSIRTRSVMLGVWGVTERLRGY